MSARIVATGYARWLATPRPCSNRKSRSAACACIRSSACPNGTRRNSRLRWACGIASALTIRRSIRAGADPFHQARRDSCLFFELSQRRRPRLLVLVDPALRHLPCFVGIIDPRPDEHLALAVEEHHADPAAVAVIVSHSSPFA